MENLAEIKKIEDRELETEFIREELEKFIRKRNELKKDNSDCNFELRAEALSEEDKIIFYKFIFRELKKEEFEKYRNKFKDIKEGDKSHSSLFSERLSNILGYPDNQRWYNNNDFKEIYSLDGAITDDILKDMFKNDIKYWKEIDKRECRKMKKEETYNHHLDKFNENNIGKECFDFYEKYILGQVGREDFNDLRDKFGMNADNNKNNPDFNFVHWMGHLLIF